MALKQKTIWLAALLAALAASAAGVAVLARRRLRAEARRRAAAQDDLVQSVQGLVLQLHAIAEGLPAQAPTRVALEHVMNRADTMLAAFGAVEEEAAARKQPDAGG